ncbi:MAG: gluconate 2-dehydrogenase subunit 3 family protein [Myxococcota bacterium]
MSAQTQAPAFSPAEERALSSVLDEIIPPRPDGRLPGAGELGLVGYIASAVEKAPDLRPALVQGLAALGDLAGRRGSEGFATLSKADKLEVLNEVATAEPAFLPGLIFRVYAGYYQNGRVLEALGMEARPPHPEGYAIEPSDLTLLDPVRQRPKFYRKD